MSYRIVEIGWDIENPSKAMPEFVKKKGGGFLSFPNEDAAHEYVLRAACNTLAYLNGHPYELNVESLETSENEKFRIDFDSDYDAIIRLWEGEAMEQDIDYYNVIAWRIIDVTQMEAANKRLRASVRAKIIPVIDGEEIVYAVQGEQQYVLRGTLANAEAFAMSQFKEV